MPERKLRVFLCHASQDKPVVRELYQRLLAEDWIEPWLDKENLLPGQDWDMEIEKAVEATDVVIVFLSKKSITKEGYIQKEIAKALDEANKKPEGIIYIIPVRLEECEVPRRLSRWQWIDYFPLGHRHEVYQNLLNGLRLRADTLGINILEIIKRIQAMKKGGKKQLVDVIKDFFTNTRSAKAVYLGEKIISVSQAVDLQIVYVLSNINSGEIDSNLDRSIRRSIRYILSELPDLLGLDNSHRPQLCLLTPYEGGFRVAAYSGIEAYRVAKIEEVFKYSPEPISLAGLAVSQCKPIVINELSDRDKENTNYWIRLANNEVQPGSMLAYPIIRGLGSVDTEPIAVLYITSEKKSAFTAVETVISLLNVFSPKIEILQRLLELKNTTSTQAKKSDVDTDKKLESLTKKFLNGEIGLDDYKEEAKKLEATRVDLRRVA